MEGFIFVGIYPLLWPFSFCWHIIFVVFSYNTLYFYSGICYFCSFISDFIYFKSLFFLMSMVKELSTLFTYSKNQIFVLLTFYIFLKAITFLSFWLLFFSIHWLRALIAILFLVPFSASFDYLFEMFLISWSRPLLQ